MIRKKDKLPMDQVMSPIFDRLHHGIEFKLISRVLPFSFIKFFAEESNGMTVLAKHSFNARMGCITSNFKGVTRIGHPQDWCLGEQFFDLKESLCSGIGP